jgi:hypothetical protein
MLRKILLILTVVVILVMSLSVFFTGPPTLVLIPPVMAAAACPLAKYVFERKAPTPKLLCGIPANICTLLIASVSGLWQNVIKCPITTPMSKTFDYTFTTNSRFLTTQLNV